jgi:hypothetical protein
MFVAMINKHRGRLLGVLIFIALVLISQLWYSYQAHEAKTYLSNDICYGASRYPCIDSGTIDRFMLGLGASYNYQNFSGEIKSGDIITIPFKHIVFNTKHSCPSGEYYGRPPTPGAQEQCLRPGLLY